MEKIGAVENLTMCLVHGYNVLLSFENLNLNNKPTESGLVFNRYITSSATSGPLLMKGPSLVTDANVVVSNVTASSVSVFLKRMWGIQILSN